MKENNRLLPPGLWSVFQPYAGNALCHWDRGRKRLGENDGHNQDPRTVGVECGDRAVEPWSVIIVEGILIFAEKALRELMDIKIFVDTDADERLLRRMRRDLLKRHRTVESVMRQYVASVNPMQLEFVEPSKR